MHDDQLPEGYSFVPSESGWFGYTTDTEEIEKKYRLSADRYHSLLKSQHGLCAICLRHPVSVGPLCVDHDHNHPDKIVRGLLCNACNRGLGMFNDDPYLLADASKYLFERGCGATRRIEDSAHSARSPDPTEPTRRLELHYSSGEISHTSALVRHIPIGADGCFVLGGREWRVAGPHEADDLVCYEVE